MPESKFLGTHLFINVPSGLPNPKPAVGSFVSIGRVIDTSLKPQTTVKDIIAPYPGALRRIDAHVTQRILDFNITLAELSNVGWQLILGTLALTAGSSVQYNPNEGTGGVKAWCKFQWYDANGTLYNTVDMWAILTVDGDISIRDVPIELSIFGRVIENTENSGTFTTLV